MSRFLACLGTPQDIIGLLPLCSALRAQGHRVHLLHTGAHGADTEALYSFFETAPDSHLPHHPHGCMRPPMSAQLLAGVDAQTQALAPAALLVHGDTPSALAGALVGYAQQLPVAHLDAGGTPDTPASGKNRELIGRLARWHFPAGAQAQRALLRMGVAAQQIHALGDTVVDAGRWVRDKLLRSSLAAWVPGEVLRFLQQHEHHPLLLVATAGQNLGRLALQRVAAAVAGLLQLHPKLAVLWPQPCDASPDADVHSALRAQGALGHERLCLSAPLQLPAWVAALHASAFVLTDAEPTERLAAALHKPVLVLREDSALMERIAAGSACLVGTQPHQIIEQASDWLRQPALLRALRRLACPYGDGQAAQRIAELLGAQLAGSAGAAGMVAATA